MLSGANAARNVAGGPFQHYRHENRKHSHWPGTSGSRAKDYPSARAGGLRSGRRGAARWVRLARRQTIKHVAAHVGARRSHGRSETALKKLHFHSAAASAPKFLYALLQAPSAVGVAEIVRFVIHLSRSSHRAPQHLLNAAEPTPGPLWPPTEAMPRALPPTKLPIA